jgi:GT2 family glycosyltransferase
VERTELAEVHPGKIVEKGRTSVVGVRRALLLGDNDGIKILGLAALGLVERRLLRHGRAAEAYAEPADVLSPSGSAALYRRTMLDQIGMFEESFFLYCEDTDLGLRARRAGWRCRYAPDAIVDHKYSQSAGRASALKAWYVERNRLRTAVRNLPAVVLLRLPLATAARYFWHVWFLLRGQGKAGEYTRAANALTLVWIVVRAHLAAAADLPRLLRERRQIRATARISPREFRRLLRQHRISLREVASL